MSPRELLKGQYKSVTWYKKVDDMSDAQVLAIVLRLRRIGKI